MKRIPQILMLTAMAGFSMPVSHLLAESYPSLAKQGYKTGKLSRNAAGAQGWTVSNGGTKYFCRMKVTMAYVGANGLVSILSNGRQIKLDRKTFESHLGGSAGDLPQLSDLKAGKLRSKDVGGCSAAK